MDAASASDTNDRLAAVHRLRAAYRAVTGALPWLDMSVWEDDPPAFPEHAHGPSLPFVRAITVEPDLRGKLARIKAEHGGLLVRYSPQESGPLEGLATLFPEMIEQRVPLVVLHTDVEFDRVGELAERWPRLPIIVESGPLKILYHLAQIEELLAARPNVYLCTCNFCNWLGIERLCARGLGHKLLFGTHSPRYSIHAAMGPIAMGRLTWRQKCDLAGNNLRRLLGIPTVQPEEVRFDPPPPFIIDAHAHSGPNDRFPVPDEDFAPGDWLNFMDFCGLERIHLCPFEAISDTGASSRDRTRGLRAAAPDRFFYFEVFSPRHTPGQIERFEDSLDDAGCVGIKIHPSMHEVEADDEAYASVYQIAARHEMAILTHSWDISETNPVQYMSHPERFERHLREHPEVRLVLGHAGGRPGAAEAVVRLCRDHPRVSVDLAGDYYDNGLIEFLVGRIGADRVIFGSDMNWIDPRANLAPVLTADLPDEVILRILRMNALRTYRQATQDVTSRL